MLMASNNPEMYRGMTGAGFSGGFGRSPMISDQLYRGPYGGGFGGGFGGGELLVDLGLVLSSSLSP